MPIPYFGALFDHHATRKATRKKSIAVKPVTATIKPVHPPTREAGGGGRHQAMVQAVASALSAACSTARSTTSVCFKETTHGGPRLSSEENFLDTTNNVSGGILNSKRWDKTLSENCISKGIRLVLSLFRLILAVGISDPDPRSGLPFFPPPPSVPVALRRGPLPCVKSLICFHKNSNRSGLVAERLGLEAEAEGGQPLGPQRGPLRRPRQGGTRPDQTRAARGGQQTVPGPEGGASEVKRKPGTPPPPEPEPNTTPAGLEFFILNSAETPQGRTFKAEHLPTISDPHPQKFSA